MQRNNYSRNQMDTVDSFDVGIDDDLDDRPDTVDDDLLFYLDWDLEELNRNAT